MVLLGLLLYKCQRRRKVKHGGGPSLQGGYHAGIMAHHGNSAKSDTPRVSPPLKSPRHAPTSDMPPANGLTLGGML